MVQLRDSIGRFACSKPKPEVWAIVGDTQVPFHDPAAVELATRVIAAVKPDHLVYNGDMIDFWSISKHQPSRHEILGAVSLQEEIDRTIAVQDKLASGLDKRARLHCIDGNHENRLEKFFGVGPQTVLGSLKALRMEEVFSYKERGFTSYHPYGEGIWITDNLFVYHGQFVSPLPGVSVKKEIDAIGASVIMNHVHRRSDIRFRQGEHEWRGIENGCLCQLASTYSTMTNWAHALTIVRKYDNRHWDADVVDIINDGDTVYCIYGGEKYTVDATYSDNMSLPWRPHRNIIFEKGNNEN